MTIEKSKSPVEFAAFERTGWDANIAGYDRAFGAVARQTVVPLLDAAAVGRGSRVLDVCAGPGMLTAAALARGAQAIGLDFSLTAVELARQNVLGGRFEQGDAQSLPFPDRSFDAVVCGYGLMHVPEPGLALAEMRRVLKTGGRAAVSVWDAAGVGFSLVYEAVRARGRLDVALPHGPDFFQFGTPAKMEAVLATVGFVDLAARSVAQSWRVDSADRYVEAILSGTVRARAVLAAQTGTAAVAVRAYLAHYLERFRGSDGVYAVPMPAVIGSGVNAP